ncbi:hypothetical protein CapIbe_010114 [Capra ibex]
MPDSSQTATKALFAYLQNGSSLLVPGSLLTALKVTPGNSSGIHTGVGCSPSPATGVAPPLSEGRSWAEKKGVE